MDHVAWRRSLGQVVCRAYSASPKVAATALGGSVARGWADQFSDVEVFVFWSEQPSDAERIAAVERSGGTIHVDWSQPSAQEDWNAAMDQTGGRIGLIWPYEDDEWSEHYYVGGVNIGVSGFLVATVDRWISKLVGGVPDDDAEIVAATIMAQAPVTGGELLDAWVSRLTPYPEALARAVIERWLVVDESWWAVDQLASRDDRPAFDAVMIRMQQRLIRLLLAANGTYLLDPKPKWTRNLITAFEHRPVNCLERLQAIQTSAPMDAASGLQDLFEDVLDLLARRLPTVHVERARTLYRHRRAVWAEPSGPAA